MPEPIQNDGEMASGPTGVLLQVKGLTICTHAGVSLLSDISFHIEPGEMAALMGLIGSGKSSLLQSLAGLGEPTDGEILIDGISLYANLKAFRPMIGYVPAESALPENLTVAEIMQDGARLRMPRRASSQDRKQRVLTLLQIVGLIQATDRRVASLGELDKRRLSIAVELIGYPGLLLVDQSSKPLTPFEEVQIIILLRELSRQGLTIVQVNPRSRSAGLSDKIIFLAPGGLLAWFGPPDEALAYLKGLLPRGVVKDLFGLQEALEILVNPQSRDGSEWAKRFKEHQAYEKYVDDPLHNRYPDLLLQTRPLLRIRLRNASKEKLPPPIVARANALQKLALLIRRNFRILWRDKTGLAMLAIPPIIALVHFVLSSATGNAVGTPLVFDPYVFLVLLTAALLVQSEIFKDKAVYRHEQRTTSLLFPYILSKLWLVAILAIYQGLIWALVHALRKMGIAGGLQSLLPDALILSLIAFLGGVLGLMVSALSRTAMATSGLILLLTVPQFLLLINPLSQWSKLAVISLFLIVLLVGIQHRSGSVRAS